MKLYEDLLNHLKEASIEMVNNHPNEVDIAYYNQFTKVKPSDIKDMKDRYLAVMTLLANEFAWREDLPGELRIAYTNIFIELKNELLDNSPEANTFYRLID
jgi:hypothetical protein